MHIAQQLVTFNITLSEVARQIRATTTETPEMEVEDIYERIKAAYIDRLLTGFEFSDEKPDFTF